MNKITFEKIKESYISIKTLLEQKQRALVEKNLEELTSCDEKLICAYNEIKIIYERKDEFSLNEEQKGELRALS